MVSISYRRKSIAGLRFSRITRTEDHEFNGPGRGRGQGEVGRDSLPHVDFLPLACVRSAVRRFHLYLAQPRPYN
jgi:hypothetical protein